MIDIAYQSRTDAADASRIGLGDALDGRPELHAHPRRDPAIAA
nr:hypothetical protein [Polymorphobacter sp.]